MFDANSYLCNKCQKIYPLDDNDNGCVNFLGETSFYAGEVSKLQMQELLRNIDSIGYDNALTYFFKTYPHLRNYIIDYRRADWISHCINENNFRCLDIGSGLGTLSETLSRVYRQVYSLEAVKERIEFQKRRFKNSKRTNIIMARGNALQLPFPDSHFDLVVCNGVLEWIGMLNKSVPPRKAQLSFLREMKRVTSEKGCVYIGIENRFGLQFLLGQKDHSGLPYTSVLPRSIASVLVRRYGPAGGIYGEKSTDEKEKRGYYTYTYSLRGYHSLLNEAGFRFKSYWVFPGYVAPYFSGSLEDKIAIKGFLHYLRSINPRPRFRIALFLLEKLNKYTISLMTSLFIPCFLFYCYKSEIPESFEDMVAKNSSINHITSFSGHKEIGYVLYDSNEKPSRIARLKRYGYDLPIYTAIPSYDKSVPGFNPTGRAWIEHWIEGRTINPADNNESHAAIKWLVDFQNKTRSSNPMSQDDVRLEVGITRTRLLELRDLNKSEYAKWMDDYESYLLCHEIHKTSEHGDFFHSNILVNPTTHKITVIDWNYFRKYGDPLFDFIFYVVWAMQSHADSSSAVEEFEHNLNGNGKFSKTFSQLQNIINEHFNSKLDMIKLIRYTLLRYMIRKYLERGQNDKTVILCRNLLDLLASR